MCGIVGFVHCDRDRPADESRLVAMRDSIAHRGPDDAGCYTAPGIALGSRRLAILDLSARGHMPMSTPDGRYQIVYNGEVYNYVELRRSLEQKGTRFRSNTDTEVLLSLYVNEGPLMLSRLNGMFAFAIWDATDRTLFLARDRLGVKPVYYAICNGTFYFASEQKALFAGGVPAQFNRDTWEELLCFRFVAGEATPFQGVRRLLPGHYLLWSDGEIQTRQWWDLSERVHELRATPPSNPEEWFRETFDDAIALRRISDVPIGVLLSGGVDSASVAASLAAQAGAGVHSFTVRFQEREYDEGPLAKMVADKWSLQRHELVVDPDHLLDRLRDASWFNDEPLAHASDLHLWLISSYAKPRVTVLLSGEGADETLGGYLRYQPLRHPWLLRLAAPVLPRVTRLLDAGGRLRKLGRLLSLGPLSHCVLFNACDVLPGDLLEIGMQPSFSYPYREQVLEQAEALYEKDLMRQAMYCDQHTFLVSLLHRNDRMTMGASIECRVPFLDYRLVEGLGSLPTKKLCRGFQRKQLLRDAIGDRLPSAVLHGRKWGFGVPWRAYLRQLPELRQLVEELPNRELLHDGPFHAARLRELVTRFLHGDDRSTALVIQLVMVIIWHDSYFRRARTEFAGAALAGTP